jgi:competence protein ComEA
VESSPTPWRAIESHETASVSDGAPPHAPEAGSGTRTADQGARVGRMGWLLGSLLALLLAGVGVALAVTAPRPSAIVPAGNARDEARASGSQDPLDGAQVVVQVSGAVLRPGLYHLGSGSRLADVIAAAGGYSPRVDAARAEAELNLASVVTDGTAIHVPSRDDPAALPGGGGASGGGAGGSRSASGPLDLNTATAEQLDTLPGIGPVTAAKIIAAREEQRFRAVDDLRTRKLVGPSTFEKLRQLVTVR